MHLPIKCSADIFIQSGVTDIFPKFKMAARFSGYVNLTIPTCWLCGICALYKILFEYLLKSQRSTHLCFRRSFDDVTRINFRFRLSVTWSSPHCLGASSDKFGADIFIQSVVYLRHRRSYMFSPSLPPALVCLSVCLTVCKITQTRVHGFGWNVACRQMSGHGRTD